MTRLVLLALAGMQLAGSEAAPEFGGVKLSSALRQVAAHLGEGGAYYSVTDVAGDAEKMAAVLDGVLEIARREGSDLPASLNLEDLVRALELHRVTALGQSAHQAGGYWHNRMFLATGGHRDGLLSVLGGMGKPFVAPAYARPDADLVLEVELNLKQVREVAGTVAAAFGPETSRGWREALEEKMLDGALTIGDFLGKFEVRLSLAVTLDPAHPIPVAEGVSVPGATVVARLDGGKWLWNAYHDMLADGAREVKREGLEILMAPEPMESPMGPIQPLLALETASGSIWFALREEDLSRVRQEGGERLAESPSFKAAMAGFPARGNALAYSSPRFVEELSRVIKAAGQNLPAEARSGIALASAYLPALAGPPKPYAAVIENSGEGVLLALNGPEPIKGQSLLGPSGTIVVAAAMATPQIFKALHQAKTAENINNAKQVGFALLGYAVDHDGDFPAALDALVAAGEIPEDNSVLTMECQDKQRRPWSYVPGLTDTSPPDRILLYGPEPAEGKRIVARVDGSVRLMPEAEFQKLLADQQEARD